MHILFLTDNFPPEFNAPANRTAAHCREWIQAGHQVTVITSAPNFPGGRVFAGYRNQLWSREVMDGIQVIRVWTYITANSGFLKRILDYISFMISGTVAGLFAKKADVIVGTSPQFFTACGAYALSRCKRVPFIFEVRDLWPESIRAVGAVGSSWLLNRLESLELFLYRKADRVVTVTHSSKANLMERGIPRDKIAVVTNGFDPGHMSPQPRDQELANELGLGGFFVAGYIGTLGMAHSLETLLATALILRDHPEGKQIKFFLLGDGARKPALLAEAEAKGLYNVVFHDPVPREEIVRFLSLLDVSIVHLKKTPLFTTVIPSKLFEYMALGLPVLHGVQGESAEIVLKSECGVVFEPENADELTRKLLAIQKDGAARQVFSRNGRRSAQEYARPELARKMLDLILGTLGDNPRH